MVAPSMPTDPADVTQLLNRVRDGDSAAANQLFPLVYADLRSVALKYFRDQPSDHTLQPTALVHEAFLRMIGNDGKWQDRVHFFAVAATAMRQILVNYAEARGAQKRGGGKKGVTLIDDVHAAGADGFNPIELDDALKRLSELDARKGRVVELRFFGGLTLEEIAGVLNVSRSTVDADWRMARAWLARELSEGMPA